MCNCFWESFAGGNCEEHGPWRNDEYARYSGKAGLGGEQPKLNED